MQIQADIHIHTNRSPCALLKPREIEAVALKRGLNCVAITDHNTIEGALEVRSYASNCLKVIIGEEIKTRQGEIIGYFLCNSPSMKMYTSLIMLKRLLLSNIAPKLEIIKLKIYRFN